jgi:hypothetical protein
MTTRQDLTIRQGQTWTFVYTHRPGGVLADLTGYSARMGIKPDFNGAFVAYLSTGSDAIGGSIALGGAAGTVTLTMTGDESASLASDTSLLLVEDVSTMIFRHDLELVSPAGVVTRALEGRVIVQRGVSI